MKKIILVLLFSLPVIPCLLVFLLILFIFSNRPSTYYLTAKSSSDVANYEVHIKYVDYGGSSGSCKEKYNEGSGFLKYVFGKTGCGGIKLHSFLVNKSNPVEVYELEKLPKNLD
jgi:hypothetical protein